VALLNNTFRTPIDAATWEWYVYDNPWGPSWVYLAIAANNSLAGVIGFAPIHLRLHGRTVLADFAHHLVLQPAYRDTLSFIALNRYALQAQAARGITLAIGPPNRTAYPIHKTLMKWADFGHLDCLRKRFPARKAHTCEEWKRFPEEFDEFYQRVSNNLAFCVEKNTAWMNWRFCARPGSPYTVYAFRKLNSLAGYVILKRWQDPDGYRKAHIVDMHASDDNALSQLIAAAEWYADGLGEVNLWAVEGYPYRCALERIGFSPNDAARQPVIARAYDGTRLEYPPGKCSLSYGDGDTLY
jgi:hypothetical protein